MANGEAAFKSMDFTLNGDFSFPKQDVTLFKYSINMLVGGLIPMQFCKYRAKKKVICLRSKLVNKNKKQTRRAPFVYIFQITTIFK